MPANKSLKNQKGKKKFKNLLLEMATINICFINFIDLFYVHAICHIYNAIAEKYMKDKPETFIGIEI